MTVCKAYGKLKQAYRFKKFLSLESKLNLTEAYVLSQFNYCDVVLQNMSSTLCTKIQKVQNNCMRFVYNLRKYDHISQCFSEPNTLNMENRKLLHSMILMHKINNNLAPQYLKERLVHHFEVHTHNTRGKHDILVPKARTAIRTNNFFTRIARKYNEISKKLSTAYVSIATFKKKCKNIIMTSQNL